MSGGEEELLEEACVDRWLGMGGKGHTSAAPLMYSACPLTRPGWFWSEGVWELLLEDMLDLVGILSGVVDSLGRYFKIEDLQLGIVVSTILRGTKMRNGLETFVSRSS
jgi:hypothetical protein